MIDAFPERNKTASAAAVCRCDPDSTCGETCINRIMSYLCGKNCPCGETCENKSLVKRVQPRLRVGYVGLLMTGTDSRPEREDLDCSRMRTLKKDNL